MKRVLFGFTVLAAVMMLFSLALPVLALQGGDRDGDGLPDDQDRCPDAAGPRENGGCPLDSDGDGIPDDQDACPQLPGVPQFNGCPDRDGDGVDDRNDQCPDQPGSPQYGGCPPPDSDGDGVTDDQDRCPGVFGLPQYNGCPPPDSDGDGLDDTQDQCPGTPGPRDFGGCPPPDRDGDGFPDHDDRCPDEAGIPGVGRGDCGDQDGDFITNDGDLCPNAPGPAETGGCPPPTAVPLPTPTPTLVIIPFSNATQPPGDQPGNIPGGLAETLIKDCALRNESNTALLLYNNPIFETSIFADNPMQPYNEATVIGTLAPGEAAEIDQVFWYPLWAALGDDDLGTVWMHTSGGWLWYNSWEINQYETHPVPYFPDLSYPLSETQHVWDLYSLNCDVAWSSTHLDCVLTNFNAAPAPYTNYIGTQIADVQIEPESLPQNGLLLAMELIRYHYDPAHFNDTHMMWAQLHGGSRMWLSETVYPGGTLSEVAQTLPNATVLPHFPCFIYGVDEGGYIIYSEGPNDGFFPLVQTPIPLTDPDDVGIAPTPTPELLDPGIPDWLASGIGFIPLPDGLLLRLGDGSVRPILIGGLPNGAPQIFDPETFLPAIQRGEWEHEDIPVADLLGGVEAGPPHVIPVPQSDPNTAFFLIGGQGQTFLLGIEGGSCAAPTSLLADLDGDGLLDFCGDGDGDGDSAPDDFGLFFPADAVQPNLLLPYQPPFENLPDNNSETLPDWLLPAFDDPTGIGLLLPAIQSAREAARRTEAGLLLPAVLPLFNPSPGGSLPANTDTSLNFSVFGLLVGDGSVVPAESFSLNFDSIAPNLDGILIGLLKDGMAACEGAAGQMGNVHVFGDGSVRTCSGAPLFGHGAEGVTPRENDTPVKVIYLEVDDQVLVSFDNGDVQQVAGPGAVVIMPDGAGGTLVGILIGL